MSRVIRNGKIDESVQKVLDALEEYEKLHQHAEIEVYREDRFSIRIRIIDPDFAALDRVERDTLIWKFLDRLPDDVISDITFVLLLTPEEKTRSFANMDFEEAAATTIQ